MYIEKSMLPGEDSLKITLEITGDDGLFDICMNGEEAGLACIGPDELDTLTVGEILRCLYDKAYGTENPRFDTSSELLSAEGSGDD